MKKTTKHNKRREGLNVEFLNWLEENAESNTMARKRFIDILPDAMEAFITPRQQEILYLYLRGDSLRDISVTLGVNESTVSRTFHLAVCNLKKVGFFIDPMDDAKTNSMNIDQFLMLFSKTLNGLHKERRKYILQLIETNFDFSKVSIRSNMKEQSVRKGYRAFLQELKQEIQIFYQKKKKEQKIDIDSVCSNFCKYPLMDLSPDELMRHCENCPIEKAII